MGKRFFVRKESELRFEMDMKLKELIGIVHGRWKRTTSVRTPPNLTAVWL